MIDIEEIFQYKQLNKEKCLQFGFSQRQGNYILRTPILNKQFILEIILNENISYKVYDAKTQEEYILIHLENAKGSFVKEVREQVEHQLKKIADACFDETLFQYKQSYTVVDQIKTNYNIDPEFPWKKTPNYAVFRHKDNQKWFAILMSIPKTKLGYPEEKEIEILNVKVNPNQIENYLNQDGFYPAYHMNKKYWLTITLDQTLKDSTIESLIEISYQLTKTTRK